MTFFSDTDSTPPPSKKLGCGIRGIKNARREEEGEKLPGYLCSGLIASRVREERSGFFVGGGFSRGSRQP